MIKVCTYECSFKDGDRVYRANITHVSASKARAAYFNSIAPLCDWLKYIDVRARSLGGTITDEQFLHIAHYRGVPFARIGMKVKVSGRSGAIVGSNSANFNVVFEDGEVLNCHPNWEMQFFNEQGKEILSAQEVA